MKIIKGVAIFSIIAVIFGSCFDSPEFSVVPEISYEGIRFKRGPANGADTLILTINFKDGDGDLGLDQGNPAFLSTPYHENNFFLEKDGILIPVGSSTEDRTQGNSIQVLSPIIEVPDGVSGKLVTVRTKDKPGYDTIKRLHPYVFPYTCLEYTYDSVFVKKRDEGIFDSSYQLERTIGAGPEYYVLLDTFYYQPNENFQNIEVEFQIKDPSNQDPKHLGYSVFDWRKALCGVQPFNQRFPILSSSERPLAGQLKYSMNSSGFLDLLGGRALRLKIQIKDRALHKSNIIYTNDFTLE